jgi:hypothetical protein
VFIYIFQIESIATAWTTLEEDYILTWGGGAKTSLGVPVTELKH